MSFSQSLVVVVDIDGFQHGKEYFVPKVLAVACDRVEGSYSWTFDTTHLLHRSPASQYTYAFQTSNIHGQHLHATGIPQALFSSVFAHYMRDIIFELMQEPRKTTLKEVLVFSNGIDKVKFLRENLKWLSLGVPLYFFNLQDFKCPPVSRLSPSSRGNIVSTRYKANEYAIWLASRGVC